MNENTRKDTPDAAAPAPANGKRKRALVAILAVFVAAGIAWGVYWALVARYLAETDDAYVDGNIVQITPQIAGTVVAVYADNTDYVRAGAKLIELDDADSAVALEQREAELAHAVREVRNLFTQSDELAAAIAVRTVELEKARADLERRQNLADSGAVSTEEVQHARDAVQAADSALRVAREQLAGNRVMTEETTIASHPTVKQAAARVRAAYLDAHRTSLPAPVAGFVAKRNVQLGQRVSPGTPMMAVVPLEQVWVEANYKESQLEHIRAGQPVRLTADANGYEYHGRVTGFAAGTGAAFALLPAQNATGNWVKVVQRLPVRIALDPDELETHPLAIGLSMQVSIDTHNRDADAAPVEPSRPGERTEVFAEPMQEADALIADIIARNSGDEAATNTHRVARQAGDADAATSSEL